MQQQNAHLEVEDRCALGSVTSRELKPWLLARQPCRWYHWSSALDQVRFKIAVRFPWGLTFHHHGFIPDSIKWTLKASNSTEYTILSLRLQTLVSFISFQGLTPSFSHSSLYARCMTQLLCTTLIRQINSLYEIGAEAHAQYVSICLVCTFFRRTSILASFSNVLQSLPGCLFSRPDRNQNPNASPKVPSSQVSCQLGRNCLGASNTASLCAKTKHTRFWSSIWCSIFSITAPTPLLR